MIIFNTTCEFFLCVIARSVFCDEAIFLTSQRLLRLKSRLAMTRKSNMPLIFIMLVLGIAATISLPQKAFADGKYDIKEMTPEVKAALENRRGRFDRLKELKAKGAVGENNRGYVEALSDDPDAQSLVESENQDRRIIYQTIEAQNNLAGAMETIEKVFAQVQRDKASPGDKIQNENGEWVVK